MSGDEGCMPINDGEPIGGMMRRNDTRDREIERRLLKLEGLYDRLERSLVYLEQILDGKAE